MDDLALILFDVDGTLVDSQSEILAAMHDAFASIAQPVPNRDVILSTVGLSLEQAMKQLLPSDCDAGTISAAVTAYKDSYRKSREAGAMSVLYPGIVELLGKCRAHENWLLGLATGNRGAG